MHMNKNKIAFFGTDEISVYVLEELFKANIKIDLIVSTPDTKQGRGMKLTPTPTKLWAEKNNVPIIQPEKLDSNFVKKITEITDWNLFIVTSYGKIVPKIVLDIPIHKTLNVHPSLLPLYRGATPIESAMLDDKLETGVTIMRIDEGVDSGPILKQESISFKEGGWKTKPEVAEILARAGGKLLAETIPSWINGDIQEKEQDHDMATFTKKISKSDGELDINEENSRKNYLKYLAYQPWPGVFFFRDGKRVKITEVIFDNGEFKILKVIPEGKKELDYKTFIQQSR